MAYFARLAPGVQLTPADAMDLVHSDGDANGGFSDVDVDLDLDVEDMQSVGRQDDDVSLLDAASDADGQTVSGDHDDFMADNEHLIEDDTIQYDDANQSSADQHGAASAVDAPLAAVDEDLLDYSDEEDEVQQAPMWGDSGGGPDTHESGNAASTPTQHNNVQTPSHDAPTSQDMPSEHARTDQQYEEAGYQQHTAEQVDEASYDQAESYTEPSNVGSRAASATPAPVTEDHGEQLPLEPEDAYEENVSTTDTRQDKVEYISPGPDDHSEHLEAVDDALDRPEAGNNTATDHLYPITVSYDGTEFWLFKCHDFEGSGDWLLEDEALASKPICDLLNACRPILGPNVTEDIELGFRVDNFRSMELYQDHSTCALISLDSLLELYLQLHAQDGITDPESFYVTLIYRPRIASMLAALNNAVNEGIGFAALEKAIDAGATVFTAHMSQEPTEYEGEEGDDTEAETHENQSTNAAVAEKAAGEQELGTENEEEQDGTIIVAEEATQDIMRQQEKSEHSPVASPHARSVHHTPNAPSSETLANPEEGPGDADDAADADFDLHIGGDAAVKPPPQEEDDLDYSDEEVEEPDVGVSQPDQKSPSPGPVGGNDAHPLSPGGSNTNQADFAEREENVTQDLDYALADDPTQSHGDEAYEHEWTGEDFGEELDENQEEDREAEFYEGAQEVEARHQAQAYDENANYHDESGAQAVAQEENFTFTLASEEDNHQDSGTTAIDDVLTGAGDFLDFDNEGDFATETQLLEEDDTAQEDLITYEDEDGADAQAPVDAAAAADPIAVSSTELQVSSPQGQKRTIDEVGNEGDATDSTDAKRPRV